MRGQVFVASRKFEHVFGFPFAVSQYVITLQFISLFKSHFGVPTI